jgi:hypothetical protein
MFVHKINRGEKPPPRCPGQTLFPWDIHPEAPGSGPSPRTPCILQEVMVLSWQDGGWGGSLNQRGLLCEWDAQVRSGLSACVNYPSPACPCS